LAKTIKKTATKVKTAKKSTSPAKKTATKKAVKSPVKKTATKKAVKSSVKKTATKRAAAIEILQDAKATNIVSLDLRQIEDAVTDYFIICEGDATTHIRSIAGRLEEELKKQLDERPWHIEGLDNLEWVIVDYVNVVIHIFKGETREFYKLEDLWSDAERKEYK
jgi:ribosome-associated protein